MSRKNVSAVVSGLGLGLGILEALVAAIRKEGGSDEDIHRLATAEGLEILAEMARIAVGIKDSFAVRFAVALAACKFDWMNDYVNPANFPASVFGGVGEGHLLAQPPATEKGYWNEAEVDVWLAEKGKEGYEAATLADGLDFVAKNQEAHIDGPVVFWASVSSHGRVACLRRGDGGRFLLVYGRVGFWDDFFRFLLRKVRQP